MKKVLLLSGIVGLASLTSCEEHVVIPPPVPLVDLDCQCEATFLGSPDSSVSYTDTCMYSSTKTISTTAQSDAQYLTQVRDLSLTKGFEIEMGSLYWNDDGSNNPTVADWQAFFNNNMTPDYATGSIVDGVIVRWTDPNGVTWESDTGGVCLSNFTYSWFNYDTDTTGKYMQFDANFNCRMRTLGYGGIDSTKCLESGHIKSAFRME